MKFINQNFILFLSKNCLIDLENFFNKLCPYKNFDTVIQTTTGFWKNIVYVCSL